MKKIFVFVLFSFLLFTSLAQQVEVYPSHWWAGMKMNTVQLMVHGQNVKQYQNFITNYSGVKIKKTSALESNNYLFIDIEIASTAKPGIVKFYPKNSSTFFIPFEIKAREKGNGVSRIKGVNSNDFIYLLMPDRFCNGDETNDFYADMKDTLHDRTNPFDRHGGDLQGVQSKLDYIKELGATTIWMTPVTENNMARTQEGGTSRSTYHGYAFTNHFEIDKRFGGNKAYKEMVNAAHAKGLKVIQDAVYNHIGEDHFLNKDLPAKDWLNQWPAYQNTSYRDLPLLDPYASSYDRNISKDGWFTKFLVDLNQRNPYVEKYLTQYMIWNTEEFGVDGWRIDTYFYSEPSFLNNIAAALINEYPQIGYFGETLVNNTTAAAYFCQNNIQVPFKHNSPGVTDFPLTLSMLDAFREEQGWDRGIYKVYQTLAQDILYKNAMRNCIFLGNHDMDRIFSNVGEDVNKMKAAYVLLLTQRGIPQIYYGDEILVKNFKDPTDAEVRKDFVGGWKDDKLNKFEASGRTEAENNFFNFIKTLANFRKSSSALTTGKLMQYLPQNGLYVYFRYDTKQTVMIIVNASKEEKTVSFKNYGERVKAFTKWKDVLTGNLGNILDFKIGSYESIVLELQK